VQELVTENRTKLAYLANQVMSFFAHHNMAFVKPVAGVFIWVRLCGKCLTCEAEAQLAARIREAGVSVGTGQSYLNCSVEPGWFRVTFAVPDRVLYEALARIENALLLENRWKPM
jgi:gliotoxin/aspirochlorine biosynthesis aminotransferase